MDLKSSLLAVGLSLAFVQCSASDEPRLGPAPDTSVNALRPTESAPSSETCGVDECPDIPLFGSIAPGCCQLGGECGGRIDVASRTWLCVSPAVDSNTQQLQAALSGPDGPIVLDPSCPDQVVAGTTLPGCCSPAGTCGVSSEPWASAFEMFGVELARTCLGAEELGGAGGAPLADVAPAPACAQSAAER
jgi:hypothetical protein